MSELFYSDGERYDQMFSGVHQDIAFWLAQAAQHGDPVLELTCGTGRVSIPLAQAGYRVTGVDMSPAMLEQARAKARQAQVTATWVTADIRDFDLQTTFPLIIFPANALCHLVDRPSFEACMACVKRHLARSGRFIVDVFVPDLNILARDPHQRYPFVQYADPSGRTIVMTQNNVYHADTQVNEITFYSLDPGGVESTEQLELRMYYPEELAALLHYNGFSIENRYAGFAYTPFDQKATKQVLICTHRT